MKKLYLACLALSLAAAGTGTRLAAAPPAQPSLRLAPAGFGSILEGPAPEAPADEPGIQAVTTDPLAAGPYAVAQDDYNLGDEFFKGATDPKSNLVGIPPNQGVEFKAHVEYPQNLNGGPFPLVVFLHGQHATVRDSQRDYMLWPAPQGGVPINNHMGYEYLMERLASHGYICVSISANGINVGAPGAGIAGDFGNTARAQLVQTHLAAWKAWNISNAPQFPRPFGNRFAGKVDVNRVGTFGHSRGGEGVVQNFNFNASTEPLYQVGIKAVLAVAPTNFSRHRATRVALGVLLPYNDGDVADLQGVHFYDDARYDAAGDLGPKHTFLVIGANHNFFNKTWSPASGFWSSIDDWYQGMTNNGPGFLPGRSSDPDFGTGAGTRKLTEAQQQEVGLAYTCAFFRAYLGNENGMLPYLKGDSASPVANTQVHASYHPPDTIAFRRDVNKMTDVGRLHKNDLQGNVTTRGLATYLGAGGPAPMIRHVLSTGGTSSQFPDWWRVKEPHTTESNNARDFRGLGQAVIGYTGAATDPSTGPEWRNEIPVNVQDVSRYGYLQFRVGVNWSDARNAAGQPQELNVGLGDEKITVFQPVSRFSRALFYPPGGRSSDLLPKLTLNTVRIPLSAFPGVKLDKVRAVRFFFNAKSSGAFLVSDLQFADPTSRLIKGQINVPATLTFPKKKRKTLLKKQLTIENVATNADLAVRVQPPTPLPPFGLFFNGQLLGPNQQLVATIAPRGKISVEVGFYAPKDGKYSGELRILSSDVDRVVKLTGQTKKKKKR